MRILVVSGVVGRMVQLFALVFIVPIVFALLEGATASATHYLAGALVALLLGFALRVSSSTPRVFYRSEALAVVAGTWLAISVVAAVPYLFAGLHPIDALFESMSGLTTTGATILTDFSAYDRTFFLWRAMTQWFGGLGVIALFVVVYATLTGICLGALWMTGLSPYDAVLHALTTLSAGGFSPSGTSVAGYSNPNAEWVLVLFMILAGTSYPLQVRAYMGHPMSLFRDTEFRAYLGAIVGAALLVAWKLTDVESADALRLSAFQVASLISSTGFASTDYNLWSQDVRMILVLVMVVGGCAGSASGGPKMIRILLVGRHIGREILQALHPRAVLPLRYKGQNVQNSVVRAVFALVVLYLVGYFLLGLVLTAVCKDPIMGFSAALACLGNIGPGFSQIGPMGTYATMEPFSKMLLFGAMWVGRLEILTVLALLHPHVWRGLQLRGSAAALKPNPRGLASSATGSHNG